MRKSANMATQPARIETALKTIDSIIDQVDVVRLYLNNFIDVPREFMHEKIEIHIGKDLRSSGKCFWALNENEYYFTIDDDLIYPPTYVEDMLKKLNTYDDDIVLSLHGKVLKPKFHGKYYPSYFGWLDKNLHCLLMLEKLVRLSILKIIKNLNIIIWMISLYHYKLINKVNNV